MNLVVQDLTVYDLGEWQKACRSFGPVHYVSETRKQWFAKNSFRLEAARDISEFVETWVKNLREDERFEEYTVTAIREGIIRAVREQQEKEGAELGLLNSVKLNGFKTLVKWAGEQKLLEEGPYEGAIAIPPGGAKKSQRTPSRKKRKGTYGPPVVNLAHNYHLIDESRILLSIELGNNYLHPYQNVKLHLEIDTRLSVLGVSGHSWSPMSNQIPIGFLESSLDDSMSKRVLEIDMKILERIDEYSLGGNIIYDDCEKGIVVNHELTRVVIRMI